MAHTFLLEIGLEEIPAHVVTPSVNQLVQKTTKFLKEQRIDFDEVIPYSTPRRLTVKVTGLADKQADIEEEARDLQRKSLWMMKVIGPKLLKVSLEAKE